MVVEAPCSFPTVDNKSAVLVSGYRRCVLPFSAAPQTTKLQRFVGVSSGGRGGAKSCPSTRAANVSVALLGLETVSAESCPFPAMP